jgi:hypothetical protein
LLGSASLTASPQGADPVREGGYLERAIPRFAPSASFFCGACVGERNSARPLRP